MLGCWLLVCLLLVVGLVGCGLCGLRCGCLARWRLVVCCLLCGCLLVAVVGWLRLWVAWAFGWAGCLWPLRLPGWLAGWLVAWLCCGLAGWAAGRVSLWGGWLVGFVCAAAWSIVWLLARPEDWPNHSHSLRGFHFFGRSVDWYQFISF